MAITFPASPSDGDVFTNTTTGVKYIYNATDGVWKTHVWPTNTDYLQLSGGTLTGDLSLGTNDLTAQDITTTGSVTVGNGLTVSDGNVVMAAGHGIDFSATADGTGTVTSELLDDYEEGTWTPTWSVGNATNSFGSYTKIGNMVNVAGNLEGIDANASTNQLFVQGLPYSIDTSTNADFIGTCFFRRIGTPDPDATHLIPYTSTNGIAFIASQFNSGNWVVIGYDDITTTGSNNCILRFSVTYRTP